MILSKIPAYCTNGAKLTSQQNMTCVTTSGHQLTAYFSSPKGIFGIIIAVIVAILVAVSKKRRRRNA